MWLSRTWACVRGNDENDCGPAAVAALALHYGRKTSLERLREVCGVDRTGASLLGLRVAVERLGFAARCVKATPEALDKLPLPAIVHVRRPDGRGHFVVLHAVNERQVVLADPAEGLVHQSRVEFEAAWLGNTLLAAPLGDAPPSTAEGTAPPSAFVRLTRLLRPHRRLLGEAFVCAIFVTLLSLASAMFIQHLVDSILAGGRSQLLNALGVGMILALLFKTAFATLRQYFVAHVGFRVDLTLSAEYARHVLHLPMKFFETRNSGEILSRLYGVGHIREAVAGAALNAIVDGSVVIFALAAMWWTDARLAGLATAFLPILLVAAAVFTGPTQRASRKTLEAQAESAHHFLENLAGVETIKAFGVEADRQAAGEIRLARSSRAGFDMEKIGLWHIGVVTLVGGAASLAVLWYGGWRVMDGALTVGQLMFFHSLLGFLLDPLQRLSQLNSQVQEALVAADRLYQVLDEPVEPRGERQKLPFKGLQAGVEFRDVGFRYGMRAAVLDGVDVAVGRGQTVAFVGESGSGKSTLLKLLMGFHTPSAGRIMVDGVDLRDVDLLSYRQRIGVVTQDAPLFGGSIRDNIALGKPEASFDEIVAAARAAGLDDFIASLPERYHTVVGERGMNLSGGQRQRLAIARALLRDPDVLIFDEATSHLDTATERAIQATVKSIAADRTVVLVAHRLSTVRDADRIFVLDHGRVLEEGSHGELLAENGLYAALWNTQTQSPSTPPSPAVNRFAQVRRTGANRIALAGE